MKNEEILQQLNQSLQRLVSILHLDPKCTWTAKFESDLEHCQRLIRDGCSASDLASFSGSVTYVFQGMGSFNDYSPAVYDSTSGRYAAIPGTEDFEKITSDVFNLAKQLKIS